MLPFIFLALVLVPIAEIAVFIKVGGLIGVLPTVALVIAISIYGAWLLRHQGLQTFTRVQAALNRGEMPVGEMLDGFLLVLAAVLMLAPGLLTDAAGFMLLIPAVRKAFRPMLARWASARATTAVFHTDFGAHSGQRSDEWERTVDGRGPIIEGEATEVNEADRQSSDNKRLPKGP